MSRRLPWRSIHTRPIKPFTTSMSIPIHVLYTYIRPYLLPFRSQAIGRSSQKSKTKCFTNPDSDITRHIHRFSFHQGFFAWLLALSGVTSVVIYLPSPCFPVHPSHHPLSDSVQKQRHISRTRKGGAGGQVRC